KCGSRAGVSPATGRLARVTPNTGETPSAAGETPGATGETPSATGETPALLPAVVAGIKWLLDLQNRDGGIPTFCRGWGALPFDRSAPDLTAHALRAWLAWFDEVPLELQKR